MPLPATTLSEKRRVSRRRGVQTIHRLVDWCFLRLDWLPALLGVIAPVVGGILLGISAYEEEHKQRLALTIAAIVLLLLGASMTFIIDRYRRASDRQQARLGADEQLAMTDSFLPILRVLAKMNGKPSDQREKLLQQVLSTVLQSMPTLFEERKGLRMVIFKHEHGTGKRTRLTVDDWTGRPKDKPRDFVAKDGGRGDAALEWLKLQEPRFVANIASEEDENWKGSGRGYQTFISVPIVIDDEPCGMVTLDAPSPGDLDDTDVPTMQVLAGFLATAYAAARR